MKKQGILFLALSGITWGAVALPVPAKVGQVREISVGENSLQEIRVTVLGSTLIVLPEGEKVMQCFTGDTKNWHVDSGKDEGTRFVSVKVEPQGASTNILHIVTDHNNEYSVMLKKVVGPDETFDPKIIIQPGDQTSKENAAKPAAWVPAKDVERYKEEAITAKAQADNAVKQATEKRETDAASFRSSYPSHLRFNYRWDRKVGEKIGVDQIFSDDKFTYIKATTQETPALYELKDKKPSLINFEFANGLYSVPKIVNEGYLVIGKEKMAFARE